MFLITDHQTSDRDCDGQDSPHIGNDLMGVVIAGQTSTDYWFTDGVDDNVSTDPGDPIIHGPHGSGTGCTDTGSPAPGVVLYYFVNSTDGATAESAD